MHIPSLGGATEWLDTEPLGPAELRGHVVLVNFWTWTCINWLRQEPYVRAWSQAYRNDGLVVTGVQTVANAVQNGIIGDDDSVYWWGPGASALFVLNGALAVVLFRRSKLRRLAERTPRTLISMGVVDHDTHEGDGRRRQALHGPHEQLDELKPMVAGLGPASAGPQRSA